MCETSWWLYIYGDRVTRKPFYVVDAVQSDHAEHGHIAGTNILERKTELKMQISTLNSWLIYFWNFLYIAV